MMTKEEVLKALKSYGNESTKNTFLRHGAKEPLFGVKVGDLKILQKKIKTDHALALSLYDTGNSDAMYLAGLIADEKLVTKAVLDKWAKNASWSMISDYTVPWLSADSPHGQDMGFKWIDSKQESIAACGWATLASTASVVADEKLDIEKFSSLLDRVQKEVHSAANRVRYNMNGFVIATGSYIEPLRAKSIKVAQQIGKVEVNMGDTACKVPLALEYIQKTVARLKPGVKRKMARC